jgi:hypothetical protein
MEETVRTLQGTPRVRRDLYSSYPISLKEQIIENNEITDDVSNEPVLTTETYAAYRPFYDPTALPPAFKNSIPRYPAGVQQYENSDDVVVVWRPSEGTSETPTTNADYYEYVDLVEEKTSEISPIACQYSAETETEFVSSATPKIVTTENPEWTTIAGVIVAKSILSDPKDVMRALFGTSKNAKLPADDVDYDYEQVERPNDSAENRPLPTNASCLPCENQVLELDIAESVELSELNVLKQLLRTLSSAPETQTEFSEEEISFDVQIDDIIFSVIGDEPALYATLGSHPELSDEFVKVVESMIGQIDDDMASSSTTAETTAIESFGDREYDDESVQSTDVTPTSGTVTETTTINLIAATTPKTKTELTLGEALDLAFARGILSPPLFSSDEELSPPVLVAEDVNANDLSSGETLMFDIVRQEPKVSLAFDGNRRK